MKKIAIVTNSSWNIINFRLKLIEELKKSYKVILISPEDEYSNKLESIATTFFVKQLKRQGTNPINDVLFKKELERIYKKEKIDLALHFTIKPNIYGSIAAHKAKIPSIAVVTGLGYTFLSNGLAAKVARHLYKFAFKRNSITIFQNPDDQELFRSLNLVDVKKSKLIYGSGIDLEHFKPMKFIKNNTFNFLFIGRLLYDKGIRELILSFNNAFNNNYNINLHIAGGIDDGNPSAISKIELNSYLAKNKNIIYHNHIDDPRDLISQSDCVVLPSYREGLPRVMLEALAMSKPVITTDVPGCREIVRNKNGLLVESKSVESLSTALNKMYNLSNEERAQMGERGRIIAQEHFSTDVINKKFLDLIDNTIQSK